MEKPIEKWNLLQMLGTFKDLWKKHVLLNVPKHQSLGPERTLGRCIQTSNLPTALLPKLTQQFLIHISSRKGGFGVGWRFNSYLLMRI